MPMGQALCQPQQSYVNSAYRRRIRMRKKLVIAMAAAAMMLTFAVPVGADAAGNTTKSNVHTVRTTRSKAGQARWVRRNGKEYFYKKDGTKAIGWVFYHGKRYYTDKTGAKVTGWQIINGHRYYFSKSKNGAMLRNGLFKMGKNYFYFEKNGRAYHGWKEINGKTYYFNYRGKRVTGLKEISGSTYYFNTKGVQQTGWRTINGKRYYFDKESGKMVTGFVTINNKNYFFNDDGTLLKNGTISVDGTTYTVNSRGVCTAVQMADDNDGMASSRGNSSDILFFTQYESGADAYRQTGGDNGNACGKYQFDYRYSLLPFVKYCYEKDPVTFAAFKPYARLSLTKKSRLQGNTKFYKAWQKIYDTYPETFIKYQDDYAKMEYYDATERYLLNYGIDIRERPYVVQGAVFSYSIQHGQLTAAQAVVAAGINNSTSDEDFLKKLYRYRIKKFPTYTSRYTSERQYALNILNKYI